MAIKVFHLVDNEIIHDNRGSDEFATYWEATFKGDGDAAEKIWADMYPNLRYQQVAIVEDQGCTQSDNLDFAFELTNHIDCSWTENEGVTALKNEVRSTSVGDIMITHLGKMFVVGPFGFTQINL